MEKYLYMCVILKMFQKGGFMFNKRKVIKLILVASLLCGCSITSAFNQKEELVLRQVLEEEVTLTSETITETQDFGSMPAMVYAKYKKENGGIPWIASYKKGKLATVSQDYVVTYDSDGNVIAKTAVIGSKIKTKAIAPKMQFGAEVEVGNEFYPTIVTYGVDCAGCSVNSKGYGGSSAGITLGMHSVRQPNGEMREGIKYGDYYIVAADPNIPLCSILTIEDHGFSGEGLTPKVPFKAIVLDRGGAVQGSLLDLFKGSQKNKNLKNDRSATPTVTIERVGGKNGPRSCKL